MQMISRDFWTYKMRYKLSKIYLCEVNKILPNTMIKQQSERDGYKVITSEEIKRRLWDGANELRGSMDASRYKDYMLGLMFYKFLSDKTAEGIAYLEECYVPHPIVGAIDKNPAQGVMLLDEKKQRKL